MGKVYIYTLTEKDSDDVKYVGQTNNLDARLYGHLNGKMSDDNPKMKWISEVVSKGGKIQINQIDECDEDEAAKRETYWINHYKEKGFSLTNSVDVGFPRRSANQVNVQYKDFSADIDVITSVLNDHVQVFKGIVGDKNAPGGIFYDLMQAISELVNINNRLSNGLIKHSKDIKSIKAALKANGIEVDTYLDAGEGI